MKARILLYGAALTLAMSLGFSSCSEDDLGPSIYEDPSPSLDRSLITFPLDTFVKKEFLEPYNLRYLYKMQDVGSDMQKNLTPCTYEKSKEFAVLCKYLWYDAYHDVVGREFLREYSPRVIHLIGSASYNPTSGTKTIGMAEGGVKITLFQGNMLDISNVEFMNEQFFKTMHHEFGHIMHQKHLYPTTFRLLSNGMYNALDWNNTPDSVCASRGFVSPYASSKVNDDWVEVMSNYIVKNEDDWNRILGSAAFDWEEKEAVNNDTINKLLANGVTRDILGYMTDVNSKSTDGSILSIDVQRKVISRDDNDRPILTDGTVVMYGSWSPSYGFPNDGKGFTTRVFPTGEYVDVTGKIKFSDNADGIDGRSLILIKLEMVKFWAKEYFNMDLDKVREFVQKRQWLTDENGNFVKRNGKFVNALLEPSKSDPTKTQMEVLLEEISQYEALKK